MAKRPSPKKLSTRVDNSKPRKPAAKARRSRQLAERIATADQQSEFLADCEAALALLEHQSAVASSFVDFSKRRVRI